ncbi:hypothetical protein GWK47_000795 [Chionoecetes opilio]|uniref:RNA-directed DNA polymerase n=1 Tax=Chionoecetes opilio TaxID=41210 RepID=A0A8J4Y907_CHIOP|nr:hypothetical protein GWK47_000795 [Chionoecetes opilio]
MAQVAVVSELPVKGVDMILGNDLAGGRMGNLSPPVLQAQPSASSALLQLESEKTQTFPFCAVTRSIAAKAQSTESLQVQDLDGNVDEGDLNVSSLFVDPSSLSSPLSPGELTTGRQALVAAQKEDEGLWPMLEQAQESKGDTGPTTTYYLKEGVLCRRWLPPTFSQADASWAAVEQIVVPVPYRHTILELAHDGRFAGHLGSRKTLAKVNRCFFWPTLRRDVTRCWHIAAEHLAESQSRAKCWYDKRARQREFNPEDMVLALLPFRGNPFQAKFSGPYRVLKKISDTNYMIATPDRRRAQSLCHVNMLKEYIPSSSGDPLGTPVCLSGPYSQAVEEEEEENPMCGASAMPLFTGETWLGNATAKDTLRDMTSHLKDTQQQDLLAIMGCYPQVFGDKPGRTSIVVHDIEVGDAAPIKQSPYRVHPRRASLIEKEIDSMLEMGLIRPGARFLAALTFNVWMVVGNFVRGGGSPARLPLSVAGCASPMNATLDVLASTTLDSTTVDQTEKSLYNISYCFNSLIGIGITMLVSNVAMLALSPNNPKEVKGGVVNPTCERLYEWAWQRYQVWREGRTNQDTTSPESYVEAMKMLNQVKADAGTPDNA